MRIALFAPHYAEYSARLALGLSQSHEVLLILEARNRRNELTAALEHLLQGAVEVAECRSDSRISRRIAAVAALLKILRFRPDVVHVQEQPDMVTSAVCRVASRFVPVALTIHDPQPHSGRDAAYAGRASRHRARIRAAAAVHHVHGEFCAVQLEAAGAPRRPVLKTAHGAIMVPERETAPGAANILFFGRMEAYKGLDVLLEAVRLLARRACDFELTLAGRGPEIERLGADFEATGHARLLPGWLKPADAVALIQQASVVVLPYLEATQSGVVAAAFANGRPVVASRTGGLVEVVRDGVNGLFVPPGSSEALADALHRVLRDDKLRQRLATGARETAASVLDWAKIAQALTAAYEQARKTASISSVAGLSDRPTRFARRAAS